MNLSFNRVILFVQNVEALKNFYQKNFGLEVSEETKGEWVVLKTGNGEITLHKAGECSGKITQDIEGNVFHLMRRIS